MICKVCGKNNNVGAKFCCDCGAKIEDTLENQPQTKKKSNSWIYVLVIGICIFFIGIFTITGFVGYHLFKTINNIDYQYILDHLEDNKYLDTFEEYSSIIDEYNEEEIDWSHVFDMINEYGEDLNPEIFRRIIEQSIIKK